MGRVLIITLCVLLLNIGARYLRQEETRLIFAAQQLLR